MLGSRRFSNSLKKFVSKKSNKKYFRKNIEIHEQKIFSGV
jgi:hypothetical protein